MSRETQLGLDFPAVNYFDGQGFMVRKKLGVSSAKELNGASICTQQGTTTELNLADYFRANNMKYEVVAFATSDETFKAYDAGRCDAFTTDASGLYAERLRASNPDDHIVLPEIISKEPLGSGSAPWRQPVGRHRPLDPHGDAERRGARRHQGQCRPDEELRQPGDQASARHRGQVRRGRRPSPDSHPGVVGGQRQRVNLLLGNVEAKRFLGGFDTPKADAAVVASRYDAPRHVLVFRERHAPHRLLVSHENLARLPGRRVPKPYSAVFAAGREKGIVRAESEIGDVMLVVAGRPIFLPPRLALHTLTVRSALAVNKDAPSRLNATPRTVSVWPLPRIALGRC